MFVTIMFFACVVAAFEISIVWKIKPVYILITETKYGGLIGVALSVMLSSLLAGFFGATGMIVMGGAIFGTIITATIYYLGLIEFTLEVFNSVKSFIVSTQQFISNTRDAINRMVARSRRLYYGARHPLASARHGNPNSIV
jgi:hypothetical protein